MPRPAGPERPLKSRPCVICQTIIYEVKGRNLRKTCSTECYKASHPNRFVNDIVGDFNKIAGKERREYLKRNYETPLYNVEHI